MEFHEKLQTLRKQKGWTQEELAQKLYVSRTAVSKWESGRGYPNIDSLKAIATCFSVTVDDLLSCGEVLSLAQEEHKQKQMRLRDLVFGLLDISTAFFFFVPWFGQTVDGVLQEVPLSALTAVAVYMRVAYWGVVMLLVLMGVLTLALQYVHHTVWQRCKTPASLLIGGVGVAVFILGSQPYAAAFLFLFLMIKTFLLLKKD